MTTAPRHRNLRNQGAVPFGGGAIATQMLTSSRRGECVDYILYAVAAPALEKRGITPASQAEHLARTRFHRSKRRRLVTHFGLWGCHPADLAGAQYDPETSGVFTA